MSLTEKSLVTKTDLTAHHPQASTFGLNKSIPMEAHGNKHFMSWEWKLLCAICCLSGTKWVSSQLEFGMLCNCKKIGEYLSFLWSSSSNPKSVYFSVDIFKKSSFFSPRAFFTPFPAGWNISQFLPCFVVFSVIGLGQLLNGKWEDIKLL